MNEGKPVKRNLRKPKYAIAPKTKPWPKIERTICKYVQRPPEAMYDLGVGPKTEYLTLTDEYPDMKLYGCEPNPPLFDQLFPLFPGELLPVGIGRENPSASFYLGAGENQMNSSLLQRPSTQLAFEAEVITLDAFDKWAGRHNWILLWLDIEGAELEALKSGEGLLRSGRVCWINLEVRDDPRAEGWCKATEIDEYLASLRYRLVRTYQNHGTHRDVIYKHEDHIRR